MIRVTIDGLTVEASDGERVVDLIDEGVSGGRERLVVTNGVGPSA